MRNGEAIGQFVAWVRQRIQVTNGAPVPLAKLSKCQIDAICDDIDWIKATFSEHDMPFPDFLLVGVTETGDALKAVAYAGGVTICKCRLTLREAAHG